MNHFKWKKNGRALPSALLCFLIVSGLTTARIVAQDRGDDHHDERHWEVEVALYGAEGHFVDVRRMVEMARHEGELELAVENENLGGDPVPGVPKRLDVLFRIGERRFGVSVPEHDHLHGPLIVRRILAASYHGTGREPHAECMDGRGCTDETDMLRSRLRDGMLEIPVNNQQMGGDPAPGVPKQLTVRFYGREEREMTFEENSLLRIPEHPEGDPRVVHDLREWHEHHQDHDHDR